MLRLSVFVAIVACVAAAPWFEYYVYNTQGDNYARPRYERNEDDALACFTKDRQRGICTRSYNCDPVTGKFPQTMLIDPRFGGSECTNKFDVCCIPQDLKRESRHMPVRRNEQMRSPENECERFWREVRQFVRYILTGEY